MAVKNEPMADGSRKACQNADTPSSVDARQKVMRCVGGASEETDCDSLPGLRK
jgi:hypothetical protein